MSEVKRYDMSGFGDGMIEVTDGAFVYFEDHQSELSELREELAQLRIIAADQGLNLKRVKREFDAMKGRATAAEQRNAELVELLRDVSKQAGDHHASHQSWNLKTQLANIHQKIDAALKPTESGASE